MPQNVCKKQTFYGLSFTTDEKIQLGHGLMSNIFMNRTARCKYDIELNMRFINAISKLTLKHFRDSIESVAVGMCEYVSMISSIIDS